MDWNRKSNVSSSIRKSWASGDKARYGIQKREEEERQQQQWAQQEMMKTRAIKAGGVQNPDGTISPKEASFFDYLRPFGEYGLFGQMNTAQVAYTASKAGDWVRKGVDTVLGEEGNDEFDNPKDIARYVMNLLPSMVEGVATSGKNFWEAGSGERVVLDDQGRDTGEREELSALQRVGAGVVGSLDTGGLLLGGSHKLIKEIFKKPVEKAVKGLVKEGTEQTTEQTTKQIAKAGLKKEVIDTAKRMGTEGVEEAVQSVAEDVQDDSKLSEDWASNALKSFGLGVAGGGIFDVSGRAIGGAKTSIKTAQVNKQTNTSPEVRVEIANKLNETEKAGLSDQQKTAYANQLTEIAQDVNSVKDKTVRMEQFNSRAAEALEAVKTAPVETKVDTGVKDSLTTEQANNLIRKDNKLNERLVGIQTEIENLTNHRDPTVQHVMANDGTDVTEVARKYEKDIRDIETQIQDLQQQADGTSIEGKSLPPEGVDPSEYTGDTEGRYKAAETIPKLREKIEALKAEQAQRFEMLGGTRTEIDTKQAMSKLKELKAERNTIMKWKIRNSFGETKQSLQQKVDDIKKHGAVSPEFVKILEPAENVGEAVARAREGDPNDVSGVQRAAIINAIHREAANQKLKHAWTPEKAKQFEQQLDEQWRQDVEAAKQAPTPKQQMLLDEINAKYVEAFENNRARVDEDAGDIIAAEQALKIVDDIDNNIMQRWNDLQQSDPVAFGEVDPEIMATVETALDVALTLKKAESFTPEQKTRMSKAEKTLAKAPKGKATPPSDFKGSEWEFNETTDGTGDQNAEFFTGKASMPSSDVPYKQNSKLLEGIRKNTIDLYNKYAGQGNFTGHISKMIPGFQERQISVADAVAKSDAKNFLDIGASEGGLAKTISAANPKIKSIALDPNSQMNENNKATGKVKNAKADKRAFGEGYTESDGTVVEGFKTDEKFDVINEDFTFQFISNNRAAQVAEVVNLLSDDGVFITNEKFHTFNREFHEQKKYDHQKEYFNEDALTEDKQTIVSGMDKDMVSDSKYEQVLKDNFAVVVQYWDSGNFKGYMASNSPSKINSMLKDIGDTGDGFGEYSGPKLIKDDTGKVTYDRKFYEARQELAAIEAQGPQGATQITPLESERAVSGAIGEATDVETATAIIDEDPRLSGQAAAVVADQLGNGTLNANLKDVFFITTRSAIAKLEGGNQMLAYLDEALKGQAQLNTLLDVRAKLDKWNTTWKTPEIREQSIEYWDKGTELSKLSGESNTAFETRKKAAESIKTWFDDLYEVRQESLNKQRAAIEEQIKNADDDGKKILQKRLDALPKEIGYKENYFAHVFREEGLGDISGKAEALARLKSGINEKGNKLTPKQRAKLESIVGDMDLGTRQLIESKKIYKVGKDGHAIERKGAEGWSRDPAFVLEMYNRSTINGAYMQPAFDNIKAMTANLSSKQLRFVEDTLEAIQGKKTRSDQMLGDKATKGMSTVRKYSNMALMGLSIRTAAIQPTSIINNWRLDKDLGGNTGQFIVSSLRALKANNTFIEHSPLLQEFILEGGMENAWSTSLQHSNLSKAEKAMFAGIQYMDRGMRLGAYDQGKQTYLKKHAADPKNPTASELSAAKTAGMAAARDAQFGVGVLDIPLGHNSEAGKMVFQLQQFNMKQFGKEFGLLIGDKDGSLIKYEKDANGKVTNARLTKKGAINVAKTITGYTALWYVYTQMDLFGDDGDGEGSENAFGLDMYDLIPFGEQVEGLWKLATGQEGAEIEAPLPVAWILFMGRGGSDKGILGSLRDTVFGGEDGHGNEIDRGKAFEKTIQSAVRGLVPGGTQFMRTMSGVEALSAGESKNDAGSTRFLVDNNSGWNVVKGLIGGQYATDEGQKWLHNGMNTIGKNQKIELPDGSRVPVSEYVRNNIKSPQEQAAWIGYYSTKQNADKQLAKLNMSRDDVLRDVKVRLTSGEISQKQAEREFEKYNNMTRELYLPYYNTIQNFPPRLANDYLENVLINVNQAVPLRKQQMNTSKQQMLTDWYDEETLDPGAGLGWYDE